MKANTKSILLVEDNAIIALATKKTLEKYDFAVFVEYSGSDAVDRVKAGDHIDLVLMDIDLGNGMDGTEAAEQILAVNDVPVVFLSSHTERELVEKTERITSYGYIVKSSGATVLVASIKMAFKLFDAKLKEREQEEALRESERQLKELMATVPVGIAITAPDGTMIAANNRSFTMLGYPSREAYLCVPGDCHYYNSRDRERFLERIAEGPVVDFETQLRRADGTPMWCSVYSVQRTAPDGSIQMINAFQDITDRRRAQEQYRSFFTENILSVFWAELRTPVPVDLPAEEQVDMIFREAYIKDVSDELAILYGLQKDRIIGKPIPVVWAPGYEDHNSPRHRFYQHFVRNGYSLHLQEVGPTTTQAGEEKWFKANFKGFVENGFLVRFWGSQIEISPQ